MSLAKGLFWSVINGSVIWLNKNISELTTKFLFSLVTLNAMMISRMDTKRFEEIVRWTNANAKALLGRFNDENRVALLSTLSYRDYCAALFTNELLDLFPLSDSQKVKAFLQISEDLYGYENAELLYRQVCLKTEALPSFNWADTNNALEKVISWFKSKFDHNEWPYILNYSKKLSENPLVAVILNNGESIEKATDLFSLLTKARDLENSLRGLPGLCGENYLRSVRLLLAAVLRDRFPNAVRDDSLYFNAAEVPLFVQLLCTWWALPAKRDFYELRDFVNAFFSLDRHLWIDPNEKDSLKVKIAAQCIFERSEDLFVENDLCELASKLKFFTDDLSATTSSLTKIRKDFSLLSLKRLDQCIEVAQR